MDEQDAVPESDRSEGSEALEVHGKDQSAPMLLVVAAADHFFGLVGLCKLRGMLLHL